MTFVIPRAALRHVKRGKLCPGLYGLRRPSGPSEPDRPIRACFENHIFLTPRLGGSLALPNAVFPHHKRDSSHQDDSPRRLEYEEIENRKIIHDDINRRGAGLGNPAYSGAGHVPSRGETFDAANS